MCVCPSLSHPPITHRTVQAHARGSAAGGHRPPPAQMQGRPHGAPFNAAPPWEGAEERAVPCWGAGSGVRSDLAPGPTRVCVSARSHPPWTWGGQRKGREAGDEACLESGPLPRAGSQCDRVKPALLCRVGTWVPSCSLGARKSGIRICLKRTSTVLLTMRSPPLGWQPSPTCPPPVQANPVSFSLQLKPIISDPEYLLDQHILISIKSSDSDESYGKGSRTGAAGVTPADRGL